VPLSSAHRVELETLIAAGVQRAFRDVGLNQEEVYELRKDLTFLREWRTTCDTLRVKGAWTIFWLTLTGITGLVILGVRTWLGK